MSTTSIYCLGRNEEIGSVKNAWRGAMYVWDDVARRYFKMDSFPLMNKEEARKVWNAWKYHQLPRHEIVVLLSTMDQALVKGSGIEELITAFRQYSLEHPNSSFAKQAEILEKSNIKPEEFIAWQQTSVGEFWGMEYDSNLDTVTWYDPSQGKHFDVIEEANSIMLKYEQNSAA